MSFPILACRKENNPAEITHKRLSTQDDKNRFRLGLVHSLRRDHFGLLLIYYVRFGHLSYLLFTREGEARSYQ